MLSGIGQGNNLAFLSSSAARPAMVGGFTMDVTGNDTPWERATAVMTHVLSRITTLDVRLLGCILDSAASGRKPRRSSRSRYQPPQWPRREIVNVPKCRCDPLDLMGRHLVLFEVHLPFAQDRPNLGDALGGGLRGQGEHLATGKSIVQGCDPPQRPD